MKSTRIGFVIIIVLLKIFFLTKNCQSLDFSRFHKVKEANRHDPFFESLIKPIQTMMAAYGINKNESQILNIFVNELVNQRERYMEPTSYWYSRQGRTF